MMNRPMVADADSPFVRTLVGHAGLPGSQVVTARSGSIFTLGERLGLSGNVYDVTSADYPQAIVIKLFVGAAGADAAELDTFSREPLQAAQLSHPNIIRVLEAGVLENGVPFVVMEKLSGQTLKEWLLHHGALSASMLRDVTRGTASALAAAHAVGIIHGAVRPDSIFLESNREGGARVQAGLVKLLDFGARSLTALSRSAEDGANRSESAAFLVPEQTEGGRTVLDARTDQFGLAATARAVLAYAPSRPSPAMDAVLRMACSRRPEDRFESIGRFVTALEEAAAGAALISGRAQERSAQELRQPPDMEATPIGSMESPVAVRKLPARIIAPSPPPVSVSRQFFDEGERMSAEARAVVAEPDFSDPSLEIPVRRSGRWVAGLAAVVLAGGLGYGLSRFWQPLNGVSANARQALSNLRGAAPPPSAPANAEPAAAPVTQPVVGSTPPSATAPAAAVEPAAATPAAITAPPEPVPAAKPARAPEPEEAPAARPSRDDPAGEQDNARPSPAARVRAAASPTEGNRRAERDPLRGYVWSPRERRLVPSYRTTSPGDDIAASASAGGTSASSGQWAVPPPPPMPSLNPAPSPPPTSYPSSAPSATEPPALAPPPLPDPIPAPRP